jgi:predicted MFS family arabinose efflux permease
MGLITTGSLLVVSLFMRFPSSTSETLENGPLSDKSPDGSHVRLHPIESFKESAFAGLYACYFLAALSGPMAIGISSPVAQEIIGLSVTQATAFVSVFAIFNATGRTLFGYLADRLTPRYASALSFLIILAASLGMLKTGSGDVALYAVCFEAFWLTMGGWIAIAPAATMTFFGSRYQVRNYGIVFTAYGIGGVLGIVLSGVIRDKAGTYQAAFVPTAILAGIGVVVSLLTLKPGRAG